MTLGRVGSEFVPRRVGAAAEAVIEARGDSRRLKAVFERSPLPMVMLDDQGRYLDVNRPGRLWFRLSLDELRRHGIPDLAPEDQLEVIDREWARLHKTGCVAGPYLGRKPDGSRVEKVYFALADVLPGRHVTVFAPADWPEDELGVIDDEFGVTKDDGASAPGSLTPREIQVLALAADGLSGPEIAQELVLSPSTVNTHFKNIYARLEVRNRAAAVAKALRLGAIG
jgi:PAS domain S-box-containing protein